MIARTSGLVCALLSSVSVLCLNGAEPGPLAFAVVPQLRFVSPGKAEVSWETRVPGQGSVDYGPSQTQRWVVASASTSTVHRVHISNLQPGTAYRYRILHKTGTVTAQSSEYTFDTSMNYMPHVRASVPGPGGQQAARIIAESGVSRGLCLVYGLVDGALAAAIARTTQLKVIAIDDTPARIAMVRERLYREGLYGARVSVLAKPPGKGVALTGNMANLIVSERTMHGEPLPGSADDILHLLAPGGTACLWTRHAAAMRGFISWAHTRDLQAHGGHMTEDGGLVSFKKPLLPGMGQWTHQYGNLGNTTVSGETLSGATGTDDLAVQWLGRPGADFGIDRNPRMPAPLAVGGRLFHQGMNRVIGLDAWNGMVLWQTEIPDLRRVNIPRDASNWCADDQYVYVVVRDRAWAIEQASGKRIDAISLPVLDTETHEWGYVGVGADALFGSAVRIDSAYRAFWGGAQWYDKATEASTAKICSDSLFGLRRPSGEMLWQYANGAIINATICGDDDTLYFIESRHPALTALKTGRISSPELWEQQFMVALDAATGRVKWERAIDTENGDVVFYMQCLDDALLVSVSAQGHYFLYLYDATAGDLRWENSHKWTASHHSGHMQHPVLYKDAVYLEPFGYQISDGAQLEGRMGARSGCHTYVGTADALLYRGGAREVSMWGRDSGKVSSWKNLRPSCWLSVVPANGLVLAPEAGGGCSCGRWIESSVAFAPQSVRVAGAVTAAAAPAPATERFDAASDAAKRPEPVSHDTDYWPTYRHDNNRSQHTASSLTLPLARAWVYTSPTPPNPAWTGPAKWDAYASNRGLQSLRNIDPVFYVTAADEQVFFGSSSDDAVHCLDASTGKEAWRVFTEGPVRLPPTWTEGRLLAGSDDGSVYCMEARTGQLHWRFNPAEGAKRIINNGAAISPWPCRTGVMVENGRAYFGASLLPWSRSYLCAIDAERGVATGEGTYVHALKGLTLQGALLSHAGRLYAPQGRSAARIYDLADGRSRGAMAEAGGVDCLLTPDGRFFSGPKSQKAGDDVVRVTDIASGKSVQTVSGAAHFVANARYGYYQQRGHLICIDRVREAPLLDEQQRLLGQKPQDKAALKRIGEKIQDCAVWRQRSRAARGFALTPEHLVVGTDGGVALYDLVTGEPAWRAPVTGGAYGLAIAEGRLFVSTDRGHILCFAPSS